MSDVDLLIKDLMFELEMALRNCPLYYPWADSGAEAVRHAKEYLEDKYED
jgi:hypothetical protein